MPNFKFSTKSVHGLWSVRRLAENAPSACTQGQGITLTIM